ncbi:hypothetical protein MKK63_21860 [Methylobacterium sp. J-088]|uniref:hypothetical protein n=1 Tax=Methylobacterium sp. J-088 TaxID=2836664 RepID=UPI001FB9A62B|nr:hypothetical protein [Methylobacterium sp. J-088]MCJ2065337.1 hypothetical protein [Methylobacterium sp. J-088]
MDGSSQNNQAVAQWCAAHPALLALGLCLFGLATVTGAWWIGILSDATASVIGVIDVGCLYAFLMVHFGVNAVISNVTLVWWCLASIRGLFNR